MRKRNKDYNLIRSQQSFSFRLNGGSSVDALALAEIIQDFAKLTNLAAEAQEKEVFVRFTVNAFENGSFEINFQAVTEIVENLVNEASKYSSFAGAVIAGVVGFFKLKKMLKSETPASQTIEDNSVKIETESGNVIYTTNTVVNILSNENADVFATKIVNNSIKANKGEGFSMSFSNGETTEYEEFGKDDVFYMSSPIIKEKIIKTKAQTVEANLKIKKPVFVGTAQWQLLFNGNTIDAKIEDDEWLTSVQESNIAIKANSVMRAQLKTEIELDENNLPISHTRKYSVVKVIEFLEDNPLNQIEL